MGTGAVVGFVTGFVLGMITELVVRALLGDRHAFSSTRSIDADSYEVLVDHRHTDTARVALGQ